MLGESNVGTQSQSIAPSGATSAPGVAVGEEGVVRDRRERRRRGRALRRRLLGGGVRHDTIQGPYQRPRPATSSFAASGPQEPGA